jgi:hypothetical protein
VLQLSHEAWVRVVFALVGLFGVAFAVSGVLLVLPAPAAGGTCGPGKLSEAPIMALLDPVSIGAGPEPAATQTAERKNWVDFVSECQASADNRGLASLAILVLSLLVAFGGPVLVLRRSRKPARPALPPAPQDGEWRVTGGSGTDWRV